MWAFKIGLFSVAIGFDWFQLLSFQALEVMLLPERVNVEGLPAHYSVIINNIPIILITQIINTMPSFLNSASFIFSSWESTDVLLLRFMNLKDGCASLAAFKTWNMPSFSLFYARLMLTMLGVAFKIFKTDFSVKLLFDQSASVIFFDLNCYSIYGTYFYLILQLLRSRTLSTGWARYFFS